MSPITAHCHWPPMAQEEAPHLLDLKICGSNTNPPKNLSFLGGTKHKHKAGQSTDCSRSSFSSSKLKIWNREVFGSTAQQKEILSQQIDHLDHKESESGLWDEKLRLRNTLKEEIHEIAYKVEISWKQNSRTHWLKHGDNNTSFFHKFANGRKAKISSPL